MGAPTNFSSFFLSTIFSLTLAFLQLHHPAAAHNPPPAPSGFESELIAKVYPAIQTLKAKITYDPFGYSKTWTGKNVCSYKGFVCSIRPDKKMKAVTGVDFSGARLDGKDLRLEGFVDKLHDLAFFHVNSNNFTGGVPKGIADIKYIYELDLSNNKLTGAFPAEVLNAKYLSFLDLRYNQFTGTVPPQVFGLLTMLSVLFINNNQFSQKLPDNLGDTSAVYLTFANNHFTGPIPKSIGRAKRLLEVLFLNNQLSGCLPYEIGFLRNATIFDAGSNLLTGPIPHSFGCLSKIQLMNFAQNRLYGAVPEIVCKLPNIANLSLSDNYLTHVGPACRKLIKMKRLDVRMNCILDLPGQKSKSKCAEFFSKRYYCPNQKSMDWVPFKIHGLLKEELNGSGSAPPSSPVTYNSLLPQKL